jgi:iron complex transport system permease protein
MSSIPSAEARYVPAWRGTGVWLLILTVLVLILAVCSLNVGASRMNLVNALFADPEDRI